jgi:hypothetical protein
MRPDPPPDAGGRGDTRVADGGPAAPAPDATPAAVVAPDRIAADPNAITSISSTTGSGVYLVVTEISGGAGVVAGMQGTSKVWRYMQPGAYLEYTVSTTAAGSYGLTVVFAAMRPGATADVLLDGAKIGAVRFGSTVGAERQAGGGIPSCCGRATTVLARMAAGTSKIRLAFAADSLPVDVFGIMVDNPKAPLPDYGKVLDVSASSATTLQPDAVSDFFRLQYAGGAWQCVWSFCFIEYLVRPAKAGTYAVTLKYTAAQKTAGRSHGANRSTYTLTTPRTPLDMPVRSSPREHESWCGARTDGRALMRRRPRDTHRGRDPNTIAAAPAPRDEPSRSVNASCTHPSRRCTRSSNAVQR